jgi:serine/threonine-protein kinase HipA
MAEIKYLKLLLHRGAEQPQHIGYLSQYGDLHRLSFTDDYVDHAQRLTLGQAYIAQTPSQTRAILQSKDDQRVFAVRGLPHYFQNLLPEGHNRERLAHQRGCDLRDDFDLLAAAGNDLFGGVEVAPVNAQEQVPGHIHRWHVNADSTEPVQAGFVDSPVESAMSLPGVVAKFSTVFNGTRYTLKQSNMQGEHFIIKLPSTRHPSLVHNEMMGFELCAATGVNCAQARVVSRSEVDLPEHVPFDQLLAVKRFDRDVGGVRIHMEELNQAYDRAPQQKYGKQFEAEMVMLLQTVQICSGAVFEDLSEVVRRFVCFVLMGNTDAHAKNWALLYADGYTARLAPMYDPVIVSALLLDVPVSDYVVNRQIDRVMCALDLPRLEMLLKAAGILSPKALMKVAKTTLEAAHATWPALLQQAPELVRTEVLARLAGKVVLAKQIKP